MFGSTLEGVGNDIDLLIVGLGGAPLKILKEELRVAGHMLPLDILYMLPIEALETNFVKRAGCISLVQLSKSNSELLSDDNKVHVTKI
jgi:hypothetical protein